MAIQIPKEVEDLLQKQEALIDQLTNQLEEVGKHMNGAVAFLHMVTPPLGVVDELKFLVLGKIQDPKGIDHDRLERLQQAASWLDNFKQGEP